MVQRVQRLQTIFPLTVTKAIKTTFTVIPRTGEQQEERFTLKKFVFAALLCLQSICALRTKGLLTFVSFWSTV